MDTSPPNKSDSNGYGEEPPQDESSENNAEQQNVDGTQDGSFGQESNQAGEDSEQQKNANSEENDNGNGETADNEQAQTPEVTDQQLCRRCYEKRFNRQDVTGSSYNKQNRYIAKGLSQVLNGIRFSPFSYYSNSNTILKRKHMFSRKKIKLSHINLKRQHTFLYL